MTAFGAPIEYRHRLIGRTDLNLFEVGSLVSALGAATFDGSLVYMRPRLLSTHYIVDLFARQLHLLLEGLRHHEHVGARLAKEAEVASGSGSVKL